MSDRATAASDELTTSPPPFPWIAKGEVLVHVGLYKTGTTSLQGVLSKKRAELAKRGVVYPGDTFAHNSAAMSVLGTRRGWKNGGKVPNLGNWNALVKQVKKAKGSQVIVSSESFCQADADQAKQIIEAFGVGRTKVLVTLRPLEKLLPSTWQEYVKSGLKEPYESWLESILNPEGKQLSPSFWKRNHFGRQADQWVAAAGAENVTMMVVDPTRRSFLHETVEAMLDLPGGTLAPDPAAPSNRSMTAGEVEIIRRLNVRNHNGFDFRYYGKLARNGAFAYMVENRTPGPDEQPLVVPRWAVLRARELSAGEPRQIAESGAYVVGDLASLVPTDDPGDWSVPHPDSAPIDASVLLVEGLLKLSIEELSGRDATIDKLKGGSPTTPAAGGTASPAKRQGGKAGGGKPGSAGKAGSGKAGGGKAGSGGKQGSAGKAGGGKPGGGGKGAAAQTESAFARRARRLRNGLARRLSTPD